MLELLVFEAVGSEQFHIADGAVDVGVVEGAVVVGDFQFEDVVEGVLGAVEVVVGVDGLDIDIFFEVDDLRTDGVGLVGGNHLGERRGGVFVGGFEVFPVGFDGRFAGGEAHFGTHKGAVVAVEVLVGHGYDVFAGEGSPAFAVVEPLFVAAAFGFE